MNSFRLTLAVIFIVAFTMIACSDDDETPTDAGTPSNVDAGNVCDQDFCATMPAKKTQCEIFLEQCLDIEDEDECVGAAWLICEEEGL